MNNTADKTLMLAVKDGALDEMGVLYERYNRQLFGFFYRMSQDAALSEDLVQNLFLRMLKYRHTYTGEGAFKAWMYHMARNLMNDQFKRNRKMPVSRQMAELERMEQGSECNPEHEQEEQVKRLKKAMQCLDEEKREILVLSRYQGLTYKEIGAIMQLTEANVKVKVFRAMKGLKQKYFELEQQ